MRTRQLTKLDELLLQVDRALRTLSAEAPTPARLSPGKTTREHTLDEREKQHAIGLMRVNHTGEVCAQALYQGQAMTAKLSSVRAEMEQAADEEIDHLAWCQDRIKQLGGHTSLLNPLWYGLSFGIGATTGLVSDKLSLGFVSATEQQVCLHLENHLEILPGKDTKSRAIVQKMLEDEGKHAEVAKEAGGLEFPSPVKGLMTLISGAMTKTSYHI